MVESAINEGRGLVMLTPHLGGFEVIPRVLAQHFPATVLYRPPRQAWLNEVVEAERAYPNMEFVPTNLNGVRQMTRALMRGEAIGILPDQVPNGKEGVWVPFFGRPAYTTPLPARLANRNHTPVLMFTAKRKSLGHYQFITKDDLVTKPFQLSSAKPTAPFCLSSLFAHNLYWLCPRLACSPYPK